jgi:drug/metabolite transporter (DMT)-like permease
MHSLPRRYRPEQHNGTVVVDQRLSMLQICSLIAYAVAMTGGQILFKAAALNATASGSLLDRIFALARNGYFVGALALYLALTVLWVWILTFTPLSRAYSFVALAFVLTPLAGWFLFSETLPPRVVVGICFVAVGLFCIAG